MAASIQVSAFLSASLFVLLAASMQLLKPLLASSAPMTILAGFLGSLCFLLLVTAISNLEMSLFGPEFQAKLPEVLFALIISMGISSLVHRVAVTTCIIFSLLSLVFLCRISEQLYSPARETVTIAQTSHTLIKKKR